MFLLKLLVLLAETGWLSAGQSLLIYLLSSPLYERKAIHYLLLGFLGLLLGLEDFLLGATGTYLASSLLALALLYELLRELNPNSKLYMISTFLGYFTLKYTFLYLISLLAFDSPINISSSLLLTLLSMIFIGGLLAYAET